MSQRNFDSVAQWSPREVSDWWVAKLGLSIEQTNVVQRIFLNHKIIHPISGVSGVSGDILLSFDEKKLKLMDLNNEITQESIKIIIQSLESINYLEKSVMQKRLGFESLGSLSTIIGRGAHGIVYRSFVTLNKIVNGKKIQEIQEYAVKLVKLSVLSILELKTMMTLDHQNIMKCLYWASDAENLYLVMNLMDHSLADCLYRLPELGPRKLITCMQRVTDGCKYIIKSGYVWLDLKIENILLSGGDVKLSDFGVSKQISSLTTRRNQMGTVPCMAPEQHLQKPFSGSFTDVWAFGILLYDVLYREKPWKGLSDVEIMTKLSKGEIPTCSKLIDPSWKPIQDIMDKCLQIDHTLRPDFSQIAQDLALIDIDLLSPKSLIQRVNLATELEFPGENPQKIMKLFLQRPENIFLKLFYGFCLMMEGVDGKKKYNDEFLNPFNNDILVQLRSISNFETGMMSFHRYFQKNCLSEAILQFEKCSSSNDREKWLSDFMLGKCYELLGDDPDLCEKTFKTLGSSSKCYQVALECYTKSLLTENTMAQAAIGKMYFLGKGVTQSKEKSIEYFAKSAQEDPSKLIFGNSSAQCYLGLIHKEKALKLITKAQEIEANFMEATRTLTIYEENDEISVVAKKLCKLTTNLGDETISRQAESLLVLIEAKQSQVAQAQKYVSEKQQLAKDLAEVEKEILLEFQCSFNFFQKSADQGNAMGQYELGGLFGPFHNPKCGFEKNWEISLYWLQQSAIQSYPLAECELGNLFGNYHPKDSPFELDWELSRTWYHKASKHGSIPARISLGCGYFRGLGNKKFRYERNIEIAAQYYKMAAQSGDALAQFWLGQCYLFPENESDVPDYKNAHIWIKKASDQGLAIAQHGLSQLYYTGMPPMLRTRDQKIKRDWVKSYDLCKMAADQGDMSAKGLLEVMWRTSPLYPEQENLQPIVRRNYKFWFF